MLALQNKLSTRVATVGAALAFVAVLATVRSLQRRLSALEDQLARAQKLRQEERTGRTAAEKKLRKQSNRPTSAAVNHCYQPIGRLQSCFVERRGTPRQGLLVPAARARLKLDAHVVQPSAALEGLEDFSHVWLIYEFHENTNAGKQHAIKAKVHPPGLGGERIGLFATRTPHRPNPIGLSVARLLKIEGDTLHLGGADLIEGTPILDVKPYLRHDLVNNAEVPAWCERRSDSSLIAEVRFSEPAAAQLHAMVDARRLRFYDDAPTARLAIEQALQLDIRSVHQGRGHAVEAADGQEYSFRIDALHVHFKTFATHVLVTSVCA